MNVETVDGRLETLNLTLPQITTRMIAAADGVRASLDEYRERNSAWVELERDHRHARAVAIPRLKSKLVADREAELFLMTEDEWTEAEMAKALRDSAKEALRANQAILSGLQSVAGAHREETRLATFGQQEGAA